MPNFPAVVFIKADKTSVDQPTVPIIHLTAFPKIYFKSVFLSSMGVAIESFQYLGVISFVSRSLIDFFSF